MLFRNRESKQEEEKFDPVAFRNQMIRETQEMIQNALQPVLTGIQAMNQSRQTRQEPEEEENDPQEPTRTPRQLTVQDIEQLIDRKFGAAVPNVTKNYVPKDRQSAERAFMRNLSPKGKELLEKYGEGFDQFLNNVDESKLGTSAAFEQAFEVYMALNHKKEFAEALLEDLKPEELPPHLQVPSGGALGGQSEEIKISKEAEEILREKPEFSRSYKGGFTKKDFQDYGDELGELNVTTMEDFIANANAKGLGKNGSRSANQGNNSESVNAS